MNVKIQNRHVHVTEARGRLIDRNSRKNQKIFPAFASQDSDLRITQKKLPRGHQYHMFLVLTMDKK